MAESRMLTPRHDKLIFVWKGISEQNDRVAAAEHVLRERKGACVTKSPIAAHQACSHLGGAQLELRKAHIQSMLLEYAGFGAKPRHAVSRGTQRRHPDLVIRGHCGADINTTGQTTKCRDPRCGCDQPPARYLSWHNVPSYSPRP